VSGLRTGTVHETGGGVYSVVLDEGSRLDASLRGRLKQEQRTGSRVVIGDRVSVSESGGSWTIDSVDVRDTELVRRGRGGRAPKILAANLDRVFAVLALRAPTATAQLIDRMLVLVESSGMHPILVLNKADLDGATASAEEFTEVYGAIGYRVFVTSAETGMGLEALHEVMCSGSSAFIGPSGAGKSSLLNKIDPALELRTGILSKKTGTGRHTTVGSRLIALKCGGLVADTPGFGDVGLWAVSPGAVAECFPEFAELQHDCRFRGCTHIHEPQCAVRAALEAGEIRASRHESYMTLRAEAEESEAH
jgi:ribosome biogenesis GTPase / thiamine phosphate phosphatase